METQLNYLHNDLLVLLRLSVPEGIPFLGARGQTCNAGLHQTQQSSTIINSQMVLARS